MSDNNKIFDNELNPINSIIEIISIGIIRLELKKLNNLSKSNNPSGFENDLNSNHNSSNTNQDDRILDCDSGIKTDDNYDEC